MGLLTRVVILISTVVCLISVAHALSGQSIIWNPPYAPTKCFGSKDKGVMISRAHSSLFANGSACGRRYRVRCLSGTNKAIRDACTGNTVDVLIVDCCKTCLRNELELTEAAFGKIARVALGRGNIEYEQI